MNTPRFSLGGGPLMPLSGGPPPSWPDFWTMVKRLPWALWHAVRNLGR
jgi:hypothetical protein